MLRFSSRWTRLDVLIVLALFAASSLWGTRYVTAFRASGQKQFFYQLYFEPAVMVACGYGFVVGRPRQPVPIEDFVFERVDRFDCKSLPADLIYDSEHVFQYPWFYLVYTVGLAWKVLGISWSALAPLFGMFFGLVIVLAYALLRIAVPPLFAAVPAVLLMLSSLNLSALPHLRDYAKAPFVLGLVLILLYIVRRPMRPRSLLALAVAYGAVLGVGYGFRTDLLANIPVFVVTLLLFLPGGVIRNLKLKAAALVLTAVTFVGVAWPAASAVLTQGGCQWHVALLGLSTDGPLSQFNSDLGVTPTFYQWNPYYLDGYLYTSVWSYHNRMHASKFIQYCTPAYDTASGAYLVEIGRRFPADMVTRAFASMLRVLDSPFSWYKPPPVNLAEQAYETRRAMLSSFEGTGRLAAIVTVLLLGALSVRLGLFAVFVVLYFCGYPALQFASRHYFHLEVLGWWATAFVLWQALRGAVLLVRIAVRRWRPGTETDATATAADWRTLALGAARFACLAAIIAVAPWPVLRAYQHREIHQITDRLLSAPRVDVPLAPTVDARGLRLTPGAFDSLDEDLMRTAYLDIHIDLAACPAGAPLTLQYDPAFKDYNFSRTVPVVPPGTVPDRVLVPVYRYFQGFDVGGEGTRCITRVERLASVRGIALLPVLTLPPNWRSLPFEQTLAPIRWWPSFTAAAP